MSVEIYNTKGNIVRAIELEHQKSGRYIGEYGTNASAHWDGRNNIGEVVSSGVYFYLVKADGIPLSSPRKLVIER